MDMETETHAAPAKVPRTYARKATGLVREIPLFDMMAYNAGVALPTGLALAIGLFYVFAAFPGANIVVALLISFVLIPLPWLTFALLSSTMPRVGGDYLYGSRILHPIVGLGSNICAYLATILGVGLGSFLFPQVGLAPAFSVIGLVSGNNWWVNAAATVTEKTWTFVIGIAVLVAISVIAVLGTKLITRAIAVLYSIAMAGLLLSLGIVLFKSNQGFISDFNGFAEAFTDSPDSYGDTVKAGADLGLVYPSEDGYSVRSTIGALFPAIAIQQAFFYGSYLAGEMKGAGRRRRQISAIAGAGYAQAALLFVSVVVFLNVTGYEFFVAANNGGFPLDAPPFYNLFASLIAGGTFLAVILALAFICTIPPNIYGNLGMCQRAPFAWSFDGLLPGQIAGVNPRTHTPIVSIALNGVIAVGMLAWATYSAGFTEVLTYASLLSVTPIVITGICAIVLRWRRPEIYRGSPAEWTVKGVHLLPLLGVGCTGVGVLMFVLAAVFHTELGIANGIVPFLVVGGCFAFAALYYTIARAVLRSRGVDLALVYRTLPAE